MSTHVRPGLTAAFLVLCGAVAWPATATVLFPSRTSMSQIDSSRSDFSDARVTIAATTQVGAGSTGSRSIDFSAVPTLLSHSVSSTGQVSVTETGFDPPSDIKALVGATGPAGGSFTYLEHYGVDTDPYGYGPLYHYSGAEALPATDVFFPVFTNKKIPLLEFFIQLEGAGLVDENGSFRIGLSLPGDYSTTNGLASSSGQHYLGIHDAAWTIDPNQDFSFDAATNRTTFSAVNPSIHGLQFETLDVYFFGRTVAAVPEPGAWLTMICGLGVVAWVRRRRGSGAR